MSLADNVKLLVKEDIVLDAIIDKSITRLESFGLILKPEDSIELSYCLNKVQEKIKNECNILSIPIGLVYTAVDMVCGEFLNVRHLTGRLTEFDTEQALKSIKTGDVTTTYQDGGSAGINYLISELMHQGRGDVLSYRKIKW